MGQMDWPIWAMAPLTGPLLPMPAPLRTGAIAITDRIRMRRRDRAQHSAEDGGGNDDGANH